MQGMRKLLLGIAATIVLVVVYGLTLGDWSIQIQRDAQHHSAHVDADLAAEQPSQPTNRNPQSNRGTESASTTANSNQDPVPDDMNAQDKFEGHAGDDFSSFSRSLDFSTAADRFIFMGDVAAINHESKDFIDNAFNDYLLDQNLAGVVHMEYSECNIQSCLVSIEVQAQELSSEDFDALTSAALFGAMSKVTSSGGEYAVVEDGNVKYLRLHYNLGG